MSTPADIPLTAELFARAIVAAAVSFGDHPLIIFESSVTRHKRALPAAALGVHLATGMQMDAAARIIGVSPSAISVNKRRDRPGFRRAAEAAREAVVYHLRGRQLSARAASCAEPAQVVDVVEPGGCAPAVEVVQPPAPPIIEEPLCEPVIRSAPRPAPSRPAPKAAAKPAQSSTRAMPKGARFVNLGEGVQRIEMQPIPERVARMAKAQLDKGADLAFVADCFDVDPDALWSAVQTLDQGAAA